MTVLLKAKEQQSIFIIRETEEKFKNPAILWSMGKDSTTVLWLVRKAFFGEIPLPVIYIDTSYHFTEMYQFKDQVIKKWNLKLVTAQNRTALKEGMNHKRGVLACCTALKTLALKRVMDENGFDALILGIRRDEHGVRAKERVFSPRDKDFRWDYQNQPPELWDLYTKVGTKESHVRVHPLLEWTELDVWRYIKEEEIPINPLYFAKNGKRYRSLGCMPCTGSVDSNADSIDKIIAELEETNEEERRGRAQNKEAADTMQRLRALGYM
jgi:sulfate adenylyltransferase subunit 2